MKDDLASVSLKTLPGMIVSLLTWVLEVPLEKWVLLATLVHVLVQVGLILKRELRKEKRK